MLKKYFIRQNYFDKYKKVKKHLKILKLSQTTFKYSEIESIWKIPDLSLKNSNGYKFLDDEKFYVFGIPIHFNKINWHKDSFSGYEYSLERFDNIKINQLFNRGIDVVFPWEQSRFYFAVPLAIKYLNLKDDKYYNLFKTIILDWINKNPFLYGINWYSTMDVAIRAINWVVAVNLFGEVFHNDKQFKLQFTKSLVQHAEYVSSFPAIYEKGHITNHTTSAYAGLLFLAITLRKHAKSKSWLKQAVTGLLKCMNYQVYDDGIDFEGSIPYHRLVLEIFCFSAIVCLANNIELPVWYFTKLFKMIEFTASYIDCQGNAPQIGDNDSGRVLIFSTPGEENFYLQEHDHSYLLDLGKIIFDNNFPSQCKKQNEYYKIVFPINHKNANQGFKSNSARYRKIQYLSQWWSLLFKK